jgi:hypothetical protein
MAAPQSNRVVYDRLVAAMYDAADQGLILDVSFMTDRAEDTYAIPPFVSGSPQEDGTILFYVEGLPVASDNPDSFIRAMNILGPDYNIYIRDYNQIYSDYIASTMALPSASLPVPALPVPGRPTARQFVKASELQKEMRSEGIDFDVPYSALPPYARPYVIVPTRVNYSNLGYMPTLMPATERDFVSWDYQMTIVNDMYDAYSKGLITLTAERDDPVGLSNLLQYYEDQRLMAPRRRAWELMRRLNTDYNPGKR